MSEIIANLKKQIEKEEKSDIKTANYGILKGKLLEAEELGKSILNEGNLEIEIFEFRLKDLKQSIE